MTFEEYSRQYPKKCQGCHTIEYTYDSLFQGVFSVFPSDLPKELKTVGIELDRVYCDESNSIDCPCLECLLLINCSKACDSFKKSFYGKVIEFHKK